MIIEKKYHTLAQQDIAEMEKRQQERQNAMTDEEKLAEEKEKSQNLRRLYSRIEVQKRHVLKRINVEKQERFQSFLDRAMWLAEYIEADIVISTEEQMLGKIEFTTEQMLFNYSTDRMAREILSELTLVADEAEFGVAEGHCVMRFLFEFFEKMEII